MRLAKEAEQGLPRDAVQELHALNFILARCGYWDRWRESMKGSEDGHIRVRAWCDNAYGEVRVPFELVRNREWRRVIELYNAQNYVIRILRFPVDIERIIGLLTDGAHLS